MFTVFVCMLQTFVAHMQTYDTQTPEIKQQSHGSPKVPSSNTFSLNLHRLLRSKSMAYLRDTGLEARI